MKTKTQDTPTPDKGISRKNAVAELRAAGYTGPVSYAMPRLRAIHAEYFASLVGETGEIVNETKTQRKNRLARERRAAKVAA